MTTRTAQVATEPFAHPALFYRGQDQYLAGVVPFITDGLAADEPVAVAVPSPQLALLRTALGSVADRVRMQDMTQVGCNPGRIIPYVLRGFADAHPLGRVRIVGEPIWPQRSDTEYPACAQHEALINHAFTGRQVTILCPYDAEGLSAARLADATQTHPVLIDEAGTRYSDYYAPDAVIATYNAPLPPLANATTLTVDTSGLARLRYVATTFARRRRLSAQRTDDLLLALTELASNSIEHAHSPATISLGGEKDRVVCQVRDLGYITDSLAGRRPPDVAQRRGRGLLLVNQVADLVRVHTMAEGTTTEIHFVASSTHQSSG